MADAIRRSKRSSARNTLQPLPRLRRMWTFLPLACGTCCSCNSKAVEQWRHQPNPCQQSGNQRLPQTAIRRTDKDLSRRWGNRNCRNSVRLDRVPRSLTASAISRASPPRTRSGLTRRCVDIWMIQPRLPLIHTSATDSVVTLRMVSWLAEPTEKLASRG
jgi:hypothetical protein